MRKEDALRRGNAWLLSNNVEQVERLLAERTFEMHCPYIYPPTSRHYGVSAVDIYNARHDWDERPPALYVHIPYCIYRCTFCNFALDTLKNASATIDNYLDALSAEIELIKRLVGCESVSLSSIYIGGGTPSVLSCEQLERLFAIIYRHFNLQPGGECSVEVNPDTVKGRNGRKLRVLAEHGLTRISLGVQSMDPEILRLLGRLHTVEMIYESVEHIRAARVAAFECRLVVCSSLSLTRTLG